MSQPVLAKKKREENLTSDLDSNEANMSIKVVSLDDRKYRLLKGNSGYETIALKKTFSEGIYLIGLDDTLRDSKKQNPKACFRLGVVCHTEDAEGSSKAVYCLGSCKNSIAMRSSDLAIIHDGLPCLRTTQFPDIKLSSETESLASHRFKNELLHDYYMVVCLKNSKNPDMVRYYKDKLPADALMHNNDSFIAFFKGGTLLAKIGNIREGSYLIGVSLYMEAAVTIDLAPNVNAFRQEVENNTLECPEVLDNTFSPQTVTNDRKAALGIANLDFSKLEALE